MEGVRRDDKGRGGVQRGQAGYIAQYVLKLDKEKLKIRLHDAFAHADKLHTNFYEDHLPAEDVLKSAEILKNVVEELN